MGSTILWALFLNWIKDRKETKHWIHLNGSYMLLGSKSCLKSFWHDCLTFLTTTLEYILELKAKRTNTCHIHTYIYYKALQLQMMRVKRLTDKWGGKNIIWLSEYSSFCNRTKKSPNLSLLRWSKGFRRSLLEEMNFKLNNKE